MNGIYDIRIYGATPDQRTVNTKAIQAAIDACSQNGGGSILIPAGIFICGTLELKSNCTLFLQNGATLKGADTMENYPDTGLPHNEWKKVKSFLFAHDAENIKISGEGTIDFSGDNFMEYDRMKLFENVLQQDLTETELNETTCETKDRPNQMVFFERCRHVGICGVIFKNSPCWTLSLSNSRDIRIIGITILNNRRVPNNDGIHISATSDVVISDCNLSCGDDCIAISCITDDNGVSENIAVQNCNLQSCSAAFRVGYQTGTIRNVTAGNITISDSNRGILIFSGHASHVSNVTLNNITMQTNIKLGAWWGDGEPFVICADKGGTITDVILSNFTALSENSGVITGLTGNLLNISLHDGFLRLRDTEKRRKRGYIHRLVPAENIESSREKMTPICVYGGTNVTLNNVYTEQLAAEKADRR